MRLQHLEEGNILIPHRFRRFLLPAGIAVLIIGAATPAIAQPASAVAPAPVAARAAHHVPTPNAPVSGKFVPHLTGAAFRSAALKSSPQSGAARWAQLNTQIRKAVSQPKMSSGISSQAPLAVRPQLTSWSGALHVDWGTTPYETIDGAMANQQLDSFTLPSSSKETIYSPTLDPSGIDCIEVTTDYVGGADYIGAWNWCETNPTWGLLTVDTTASFQADYTTVISGRRFYTVKDMQTNATTNQWTAYLYNYSTGDWDVLFQSASTSKLSNSGGGWDLDEVYTYYDSSTQSGTYCNEIGSNDWESTNLTYLIGGSWVPANSANADVTYPSGLNIGCPAAHFTSTINAWHTAPTGTHAAATIIGTDSGKCLDVPNAHYTNGQTVDISTCNGSSEQAWTYTSTGELTIDSGHYCLEVYNSATADNSEVDIWTCNNSNTQEWTWSINTTLVGINSGKCLDVVNGGTTDGTPLQIYDCLGVSNQQWSW
jgi:hypothetical protein